MVGVLHKENEIREGYHWVSQECPICQIPTIFIGKRGGFSPRSLRKLLAKYELEPRDWNVYGGTSVVPSRGGLLGRMESVASILDTAISNLGEMGTYIETWAVKK